MKPTSKLSKIYFFLSLTALLLPILMGILFIWSQEILVKTVVGGLLFASAALPPAFLLWGLYLAFFTFKDAPARHTWIRAGIYINLLVLPLYLTIFI